MIQIPQARVSIHTLIDALSQDVEASPRLGRVLQRWQVEKLQRACCTLLEHIDAHEQLQAGSPAPDVRFKDMRFSMRARTAVRRVVRDVDAINPTVAQLAKYMTREKLLRTRNCGALTLKAIEDAFAYYGQTIKES